MRNNLAKLGIINFCHSLDIRQNFILGYHQFPDLWSISNYHIDAKLESIAKIDKRKTTKLKKFNNDVILANYDVILVVFYL